MAATWMPAAHDLLMMLYSCALLLWFSVSASEHSQSRECNICGEGYSISVPEGSVRFEYHGRPYQFTCNQLQDQLVRTSALSLDFCIEELPRYTAAPCRCATADGQLKTDLLAPTQTPTENSFDNHYPSSSDHHDSEDGAGFLDGKRDGEGRGDHDHRNETTSMNITQAPQSNSVHKGSQTTGNSDDHGTSSDGVKKVNATIIFETSNVDGTFQLTNKVTVILFVLVSGGSTLLI